MKNFWKKNLEKMFVFKKQKLAPTLLRDMFDERVDGFEDSQRFGSFCEGYNGTDLYFEMLSYCHKDSKSRKPILIHTFFLTDNTVGLIKEGEEIKYTLVEK